MQLRFRGTQKTEEVCNRRKETPGTEGGGREAERGESKSLRKQWHPGDAVRSLAGKRRRPETGEGKRW